MDSMITAITNTITTSKYTALNHNARETVEYSGPFLGTFSLTGQL